MRRKVNKRQRRRQKRNLIFLCIEVLVLILCLKYVRDKMEYMNVFYEGTVINEVDCSFLTVDESKEILEKGEYKSFEIIFKDNKAAFLDSSKFYVLDDMQENLKKVKAEQNKGLTLKGKKYEIRNYIFDADVIKEQLANVPQLTTEYMEENSEIIYEYNDEEQKFQLSKKDNYYLNIDDVAEAVIEAIQTGHKSLNVSNLYQNFEDDTISNANSKISSNVIYQLHDNATLALDASILHTWFLQDDGTYKFDEEVWNKNLEKFVSKELKEATETVGRTREFKPTGMDKVITISGGKYGYQLDTEAEVEQLKKDLSSQNKVEREPIYQKKEVSSENDGLGNTYVEIDLSRQKVWMYVAGTLKVETDCVTGCVNKGHETPTGIDFLTYKQTDRILRGKKLPNGKYEYESHVDYWMPFNGGIGLHDASWRKKFGGDIYIKNGSHGCINLPSDKAEEIYNLIDTDMPIIVYKS